MVRLPIPGSDDGQWGDILNTYLSQSHNSDGTLKPIPQTTVTDLTTNLAAKANTTDLSPVATTGSYTDLANKPTIPPPTTDASQLTAGTLADARLPVTAQAGTLSGTYAARGSVTLYPGDYGAVGDGVTDDTAAINAMVAAGNALVTAGHGHVIFQFDAKTYLLVSAPTHPNGIGEAYAQIPLPMLDLTANRAIFEFRGAGISAPPLLPMYLTTTAVEYAGTVFHSTATGGLDASYGIASVIGGPAWKANVTHNAMLGTGGYWSNITIVLDSILIRRPDNPSIAGADFSYCLQAKTNNVAFDLDALYNTATFPTYYTNIALLMPEYDNNLVSTCAGETYIFGSYCALRHSEHFMADHLMLTHNVLALAPGAGYHASVIVHASIEHNNYVIGNIDPATGVTPGAGVAHLKIGILAIENAAAGTAFANIVHINQMDALAPADEHLYLDASYTIADPVTPNADITFTGANRAWRLKNLAIQGNDGGAWTPYTPVLGNWTVGNGTIAGSYLLDGKTLHWEIRFTPGTTSTFAGGPSLGLPAIVKDKNSPCYGWCQAGGNVYALLGYTNAGAAFPLVPNGPNTWLSATVPGAWGSANDFIALAGTCEFSYF